MPRARRDGALIFSWAGKTSIRVRGARLGLVCLGRLGEQGELGDPRGRTEYMCVCLLCH